MHDKLEERLLNRIISARQGMTQCNKEAQYHKASEFYTAYRNCIHDACHHHIPADKICSAAKISATCLTQVYDRKGSNR